MVTVVGRKGFRRAAVAAHRVVTVGRGGVVEVKIVQAGGYPGPLALLGRPDVLRWKVEVSCQHRSDLRSFHLNLDWPVGVSPAMPIG